MITTKTAVHTVYLRPNPRLPKVLALAILLDHLSRTGQPTPGIVMMPEDKQPRGEGIYNLDCGDNAYRKRGKSSELRVVMEDFRIEPDQALNAIIGKAYAHNKGNAGAPTFNLNRGAGSIGWFTSFGWSLIEEVPAGHWRWAQEMEESGEGIVLDDNRRPKMIKSEKATALGANDFLGMVIDVILTHLAAERLPKEERKLLESMESSKVISKMLNAKFEGSDLAMRAVRSGNFDFPTMSRYIRDMYVLGTSVDDIRLRMRPWLRLWEMAGDCYDDAESLVPTKEEKIYSDLRAVAFDLSNLGPAADGNPLVHQRWLGKRDEHGDRQYGFVVVRRATGHIAIFGREYEDRLAELHRFLDNLEPGQWFFQGGMGLYNGSLSRTEVPPTKISLTGTGENLMWYLSAAIKCEYYFAANAMIGNPLPATI